MAATSTHTVIAATTSERAPSSKQAMMHNDNGMCLSRCRCRHHCAAVRERACAGFIALLVIVCAACLGTADAATLKLTGRLQILDTHFQVTWFITTGISAFDPASRTYQLPAQPKTQAGTLLKAGDWAALTCTTKAGDDFTCSSVQGVSEAQPPGGFAPGFSASGAAKGDITLLVHVVSFTASPGCAARPAGYSIQQVTDQLFGAGGVAELFDQCSYGKTQIVKAKTKVLATPIPCIPVFGLNACGAPQVAQAAVAKAAQLLGLPGGVVPLTTYNRQMFIMPDGTYLPGSQCGWLGLALAPGFQTWLQADLQGFQKKGTVMQELLHNYGLQHSYRGGIVYEDYSTCMGRGDVCPDAYEIGRLRWAYPLAVLTQNDLPPGLSVRFELPATYLGPSNAFLKVRPDWLGDAWIENVYMALRASGGGDKLLADDFNRKLNIHTVDRTIDDNPDSPFADDPQPDVYQLLAAGTSSNLVRFKLMATTGALLAGGTRLDVTLCRYSSTPDECATGAGKAPARGSPPTAISPRPQAQQRSPSPSPRGSPTLRSPSPSSSPPRGSPAPRPSSPVVTPSKAAGTSCVDRRISKLGHPWCSYAFQALTEYDCDGDGIKDAICNDQPWGHRGVLLSTHDCADDNWASGAKYEICPALFKAKPSQPCVDRRLSKLGYLWCTDAGQSLSQFDCDGDGILDAICNEQPSGNRGVLLSTHDCASDSWPNAKDSVCPRIFSLPPPSSTRPCVDQRVIKLGIPWCTYANMTLTEYDCDGDGIKDAVCNDQPLGNRGVLLSSHDCGAYADDNWPTAKDAACPALFKATPKQPCVDRRLSKLGNLWCTDAGQSLSQFDCDGDGVLDAICNESPSGNRGVLLSTHDCASDSWPNAADSICPKLFKAPATTSPRSSCVQRRVSKQGVQWCSGTGDALTEYDCDGDGVLDAVCIEQPSSSKRGVLLSTHNCADDSWPNAKDDVCPAKFKSKPKQPCADRRISKLGYPWCTFDGQTMSQFDCDGDGILDAICVESPSGNRGVLLSTHDCADDSWPNAKDSVCPRIFSPPSKPEPPSTRPCVDRRISKLGHPWCAYAFQALTEYDCDGDGIKDAICNEQPAGQRGVLLSTHDCADDNWPNAKQDICPALFKPKPSQPCIDRRLSKLGHLWCTGAGQSLSQFDCDGDGILDAICNEQPSGNRGVLLSTHDCADDSWPNAKDSVCPRVFSPSPS